MFRDRFKRLSNILKERGVAVNDIETMKKKKPEGTTRVIGMVNGIDDPFDLEKMVGDIIKIPTKSLVSDILAIISG